MKDDSTILFTDIKKALDTVDGEALNKPAALLAVGGELNGTLFNLLGEEVTVGRSIENTIPLEFNGVSRCHFKITCQSEKKHFIVDAGSKNGTYLNNQKLEKEILLKKGDTIKIGPIALKYLPKGDLERLTYDQLQYKANTDGLTRCYNKTFFQNRINMEVKKSKLNGKPLSLIVFDIDHFKKLNDLHGHAAGDFVLKEMAHLVRQNGVREKDVFARYGGEEFVILLPETNLKQGFEIAERLRKLIEEYQFIYEEKYLPTTASMGVADYREGVQDGMSLFKRADEAVYKSKKAGRNQVHFYRAN